MKIIVKPRKPALSKRSPPLCTFRTSKNYLWCLIRDLLSHYNFSSSAFILDAACHASLTRNMFPQQFRYFGLDISLSRLSEARKVSAPGDTFFHADLIRPIPVHNYFDIIVSCNTISHIPAEFHSVVLDNLCQMLKYGHDLFLNCSLDGSHAQITRHLLTNFSSVECIYFDSIYSSEVEDISCLNASNIVSQTIRCESSIPNDASIHRQLLLHARSLERSSTDGFTNTLFPSDSLISLNVVPKLTNLVFSDDSEFVYYLSSKKESSSVFITSKFFSTDIGRQFCLELESMSFPFYVLSSGLDIPAHIHNFYYVGLEQGWSWDLAQDRIAINQLRQRSQSTNYIVFVKKRAGVNCKPSVVSSDF